MHAHIDDPALAGDSLTVHHVKLRLLERRRHLVLDNFDARAVSNRFVPFLEGLDPPYIKAHGGIELQGLSTRGGFWITEEDTDLFAQLIDEDCRGARCGQCAGDLTQRLAHQPSLQPDVRIAHLAFDLRLGHQCGNGIDDDDVKSPGADQHIRNLKRLFSRIRLRHDEGIGIHAELARIFRIQRVLRIDESSNSTVLLRIGNAVKGHGGFSR